MLPFAAKTARRVAAVFYDHGTDFHGVTGFIPHPFELQRVGLDGFTTSINTGVGFLHEERRGLMILPATADESPE